MHEDLGGMRLALIARIDGAILLPRARRGELEIHIHLGSDLDGIAVENRRPVDPLLDSVDGCWNEERMPTNEVQILDEAVGTDERTE